MADKITLLHVFQRRAGYNLFIHFSESCSVSKLHRMIKIHDKFDRQVWEIVAGIPPGQVMSYGEVARVAGFPRYSRMVSRAMGRSPKPLPWFRVVRSNRTIAFEPGSKSYRKQVQLLKQEGVRFEGLKVIAVNPTETLDKMLWGPED